MYVVSGDAGGTVYKVSLSAGGKDGQVSEFSYLQSRMLNYARVMKCNSDKQLVKGGQSRDHDREA